MYGTIVKMRTQPGKAGELKALMTNYEGLDVDGMKWLAMYQSDSDPDEVWVAVDPWPEERFRARVGFISRQAEFTPGNVQTPEERSKQVFRIKATLTEGLGRLRAGMSADVWLEAD